MAMSIHNYCQLVVMSIHNGMTVGTYSNIRILISLLIINAMSMSIRVMGINIEVLVESLCLIMNNSDGII